MSRWLGLAIAPVTLAGLILGPTALRRPAIAAATQCQVQVQQAGQPRLQQKSYPCEMVVAPIEGHAGDIVYLTGTGWLPHQRLEISMYCPNWGSYPKDDFKVLPPDQGPTPDKHGAFRAYPIQILKPDRTPMGCTIYAGGSAVYGSKPGSAVQVSPYPNPFLPPDPPTFSVVPAGASVHPQWKAPWVKVTAKPRRVRSGFNEYVYVNSWAGATVTVQLTYPGTPKQQKVVDADLNGNGKVQFHVAIRGASPVEARVVARANIGTRQSKTRAALFTIEPK